jgi:hypothetical protein
MRYPWFRCGAEWDELAGRLDLECLGALLALCRLYWVRGWLPAQPSTLGRLLGLQRGSRRQRFSASVWPQLLREAGLTVERSSAPEIEAIERSLDLQIGGDRVRFRTPMGSVFGPHGVRFRTPENFAIVRIPWLDRQRIDLLKKDLRRRTSFGVEREKFRKRRSL